MQHKTTFKMDIASYRKKKFASEWLAKGRIEQDENKRIWRFEKSHCRLVIVVPRLPAIVGMKVSSKQEMSRTSTRSLSRQVGIAELAGGATLC